MTPQPTDSRLANLGAETIHDGYNRFKDRFDAVTRRAKGRFERREWAEMRADAQERLALYRTSVDRMEEVLRDLMGDRIEAAEVWTAIKAVYSGHIADRTDWEVAETYFNSITRRIFTTVGVDPRIEFVATDFDTPPIPGRGPIHRTYPPETDLASLVETILSDYGFAAGFRSLGADARTIAGRLETRLQKAEGNGVIDRIEMLQSPFFRSIGAYLVGRIRSGGGVIPFVIALLHPPGGITADALLLHEGEVSILFSFTRSHFFVDAACPYDLVRFLKTLIPRKSIAELYISMGYDKHGKTEIYRELRGHMRICCEEQFDRSPGQRGMVMIVFNMESDERVFKVIRDRFPSPKRTTRNAVMEKYDFVYRHDRAGRMVEAQSFDHLKFDHCCFSESLLAELKRDAAGTVHTDDGHLIIDQAYVERRVTPLDIYIKTADGAEALSAVLDFAKALKDLALSNIFVGDLLIKNFGVTRMGRVVFYDYDEIIPLTDCQFRRMPEARHYEDELADEPWFSVGENDVFPEEFPRFLGLPPDLMTALQEAHGDLFGIDFWQETQEALKVGRPAHIFPYSDQSRLGPASTKGYRVAKAEK